MRRKSVLIVSAVALVALVFAVLFAPTLYHRPGTVTSASTTALANAQCVKADPAKTYPLLLEMWNSAGLPVMKGWIELHDPDRGAFFEEGYSFENGTYKTRHLYSPLQNVTLVINDFVLYENYVVTIFIPNIVCADGYIHIQVKALAES